MRISDWSSDVCSSDLPGKVLAALVATMIGALSMAISSVVVNEATGFQPSEFPYTVAFLAPLTVGYILVFSPIIAFVVVQTVILFHGLISIWPRDHRVRRDVNRLSVQTFSQIVHLINLFSPV